MKNLNKTIWSEVKNITTTTSRELPDTGVTLGDFNSHLSIAVVKSSNTNKQGTFIMSILMKYRDNNY